MKTLYFSAVSENLNQNTTNLVLAYLQAKTLGDRQMYFTPEVLHAELYCGAKMCQADKKEYVSILNAMPFVHHAHNYLYYVIPSEVYGIRYEEGFVSIPVEDFWAIVNAKITRAFSHYLFMVRSFNSKLDLDGIRYSVGFMAQGYFANEENVSIQTISRKNHLLEKHKILYFRHGAYDMDTKKTGATYYCRYEYGEMLAAKNLGSVTSGVTNARRAVSMRYMHFMRNPNKYTLEELEQLYDDVTAYNESTYDKSRRKDPQPILDIINALC